MSFEILEGTVIEMYEESTDEQHLFVLDSLKSFDRNIYYMQLVSCMHCSNVLMKGIFLYDENGRAIRHNAPVMFYKKEKIE